MFKSTQVLLKGLPREPVMGRAKRGLYHGKHITFGNTRAHSERKTRRAWLPNIQTKKVFSEILNRSFTLKMTTSAIRCIDKAGGFDNYMLETRAEFLGHSDSIGLTIQEAIRTIQLHRQLAAARGINLTSVKGAAETTAAVEEAISETPTPVASA